MAVSPGMDKAVVVRELADGRTDPHRRAGPRHRRGVRAQGLDRGRRPRARSRATASRQAGRAALKRLLAEHEAARQGFAEAPAAFADQHRDWGERETSTRRRRSHAPDPLQRAGKPAGWRWRGAGTRTASRSVAMSWSRPASGCARISNLAQMGPRVAQNWDRFLTGGDRGGFVPTPAASGPEGARDRVRRRCAIWARVWAMWCCAAAAFWKAWSRRKSAWAGRRAPARSCCASRCNGCGGITMNWASPRG